MGRTWVQFLEASFRLFNSVIFGIALMLCIAIYVAVGSGFPSLRAWLEMTDLQFFNWWPLRILMILLITNLVVVTFYRIPFTPPRYGVWMIHSGIVILILGMGLYFSNKVEGLVRIFTNQTVSTFYDHQDRALHMRLSGDVSAAVALRQHVLPSLPRFNAYAPEFANHRRLDRPDLRNIVPMAQFPDPATGAVVARPLAEVLGLPHPLTLDVVAYYNYADYLLDFDTPPDASTPAVRLSADDPHGHGRLERFLVASEPGANARILGDVEIEHRHLDDPLMELALIAAASDMHLLNVLVGDETHSLAVSPGHSYPVGQSGYTLAVEQFIPNWTLIDGETVKPALYLRVMHTADGMSREFGRMVIDGMDLQTDFLFESGGGPMGKRQAQPVDPRLKVGYRFGRNAIEYQILPMAAPAKHLLLTGGAQPLILISSGPQRPTSVERFPDGVGRIVLGQGRQTLALEARAANVRVNEQVLVVPPERRNKTVSEVGAAQIVKVRITCGDWSRTVAVPYRQWAREETWRGPRVRLPGTKAVLELQLGQMVRPLPANIRLDKFELVHYPGGEGTQGIRDYRSTLTLTDPQTGESFTDAAHMNSPVHSHAGRWAYFQAQWDPEGQRFTVLGVGHRFGINVMVLGCVLMAVGLAWAFYLKPILIRRMKQRAMARASERPAARRERQLEEAGVN